MNKATKTLVIALGSLAGLMGIEHGLGEILQGLKPVPGIFILSWPDSSFFKIMSGEPAMTIFPTYLLSGLFSILFSILFLLILYRVFTNRLRLSFLFLTILGMLLSGAGFGPPLVGVITGIISSKINSPLTKTKKISLEVRRILSSIWLPLFIICLLGWIMLFPGAVIISYFFNIDNAMLMIIPICVAFGLIPFVVVTGLARDSLHN